MIVYNITNKVRPAVEEEWVAWQRNEHIPDIMASGCFTDYKFFHLLEQDESEGASYVVQYFAANLNDYERYIEKHAPLLREKAFQKWGDQFIAFRTLMQVVN